MKEVLKRTAAITACAVTVMGAGVSYAHKLPRAPHCPVFPRNNPWNTDISRLPVHPMSDTYIQSIGPDDSLQYYFGTGRWERQGIPGGIPYNIVDRRQRRVRVTFAYPEHADQRPYPIPRNPKIEGGPDGTGDRHLLMVDRDRCRLYELYMVYRHADGWHARLGAIFNLRSNRLRPAGKASADAAGLPILPGLARYDEVKRGRISHALRFFVQLTRRSYVYPARNYNFWEPNDFNLPPMGLRFRLKASYNLSGFPPQARIVLQGLKRYGMMIADNGPKNWTIGGAPDLRWSHDQLRTLKQVKGSDFEVVDTSSLPKPGL